MAAYAHLGRAGAPSGYTVATIEVMVT